MKFLHLADLHLDSPYTELSKNDLGQKRRLEQREVLKSIIEYIKENDIEYLFIAGDFYEHDYIKESTIKYVNGLFESIPYTKIFISPGNHDPYVKNSYYNNFDWSENVMVFTPEMGIYEDEYVDIYGFGYPDFNIEKNNIDEFKIINPNKINILLIHADLNASKDMGKYFSVNETELKKLNFNYVALGHIHKRFEIIDNDNIIVYPGSCISHGFDELGEHGVILGNINIANKKIKTEFLKMDKTEFKELEIDISNIYSEEELIEFINNNYLQEKIINELIKIILTGKNNFEIKTNNIIKYIENKNILKIKNNTKQETDFEIIAKENTLRGMYVKKLLEKIDKKEYSNEIIFKAISLGLEVLE